MNIVLLGSGNVATQLGRAFKLANQTIVQVWSPTFENAAELADSLAAEALANLDDLDHTADLYIISVKDDAIRDVAASLKIADKLMVHTSGTTGLDILEGTSTKIGVLYPLQTFTKARAVDFRSVPIAIEGNSDEVVETIRAIADRISEKVTVLSSEQRRALHIAAVFACNFTNHLFTIASDILKEQNLDFNLLRPLIAETAEKIRLNEPSSVQTGPAVRNDKLTIDAHLKMLEEKPALREIYQKLSQDIVNLHRPSEG